MSKTGAKRAARLRKRLRAKERDLLVASVISVRTGHLKRAAYAYVLESYEPNIREPFSTANRRDELVAAVFALYPELHARVRARRSAA